MSSSKWYTIGCILLFICAAGGCADDNSTHLIGDFSENQNGNCNNKSKILIFGPSTLKIGDESSNEGILKLIDSKAVGEELSATYRIQRDFGVVTLRLQYKLLTSGAVEIVSSGSKTVFNDGEIAFNPIPLGTLYPCK